MKKTTFSSLIKNGVMAMGILAVSSLSAQFQGDWKLTPKAGAIGVGPSKGDISWWSNPAGEVAGVRACQFDDIYQFNADGTFKNILGTQTYVEGWQGGNGCASPVAPHDGTNTGKWIYDNTNKTLTIIGKGNYVGIPKVYTGGELAKPADAKDTIVYQVTTLTSNSVILDVPIAGGAYWRFELSKDMPAIDPTGDWKLAPKAGALGVGPAKGDISWWSNPAAEVAGARACQFDDIFQFKADGTFNNILGTQTFLEGWQGGAGCGTPVAPHDGSKSGKWSTDKNTSTIMIVGKGSFIGLPKPYNGGELSAPSGAKDTIVYIASINVDTMMVDIAIAGGAYWHYELVKSAPVSGVVTLNNGVKVYPNPTSGTINIEMANNAAIKNIEIFNTIGMRVMQVSNVGKDINVASLPVGTYFLNVTTANGVSASKFIKQ